VTLGHKKVSQTPISANYISNGAFDEQVMTESPWTGTTENLTLAEGGGPGDGAFSIQADDDNTLSGAVWVKASAYTSFGIDDVDDNSVMTTEDGHDVTGNYLWLTLGNSGIPPETYSGRLWYAIANGT
jgi:hypothetical protein